MLLRNLKAPDGRFIDLLIEDGAIAAIGDVGTLVGDGQEVDCGGRLLYPGFVDAHAHIDKSLLGLGWYRNEVGPTIEEMIDNGAPKQSEWYGAFTLIVSLAWVYYEAVKLVFRLALLFGNRD